MNYIDDYCSTLSDEERELHKDLIEECVKRDLDIIRYGKEIKFNINRMRGIIEKIGKDIEIIEYHCNLINKKLISTKFYSDANFLKSLPDENFYNA